jgi:hypothetical protein
VLEDQTGVDQVDGGGGLERQVRRLVQDERDVVAAPAKALRLRDHRWRDVHGNDLVQLGGQGSGQAPDAAAEVQPGAAARQQAELPGTGQSAGHLGRAGGEKRIHVPPATLGPGRHVDRPERVLLTQGRPVALHVLQAHGVSVGG